MPRRRVPSRVLATSVAALLGFFTYTQDATAQQYWDGTGGESTVLEGGAGTWNKTKLNWSPDAAGTTNVVYDPNQTSIFQVAGGIIVVSDDLAFTNLTFNVNGYVIGVSSVDFGLLPTGTAILNAAAGVRTTIAAPFKGSGALSITGAGTIILNAASENTGGTTLSNGSLILNADKALGTGTLVINGASTLGSYAQATIANNISVQSDFSVTTGVAGRFTGNNFFLDGDIDLNGATRVINGTTDRQQIQFGGTISNGGVTFATPFTAPGDYVAFIFKPENVNTYNGVTTIGNGAFLVLEGDTANGAIQGDVMITGNGVLDYLAGNSEQVADNAMVTVNSNGNLANGIRFTGFDLYNAFPTGSSNTGVETIGSLFGNGSVGLSNATLAVGSGTFAGTIIDGFHGTTGGKLTKYGAGTLTLSGANTYTGATTITGGTLQAGAVNTFSGASTFNVGAGTTLDLNNFDQRIGSLAGSGTVNLGTATLSTGRDNSSTTFSGVVQGTGGLTKTGTGTMTLTGANTYTGATTVTGGGKLIIDTVNNAQVLATASSLNMAGGTFQIKGVAGVAQSQTINGGFSITKGANTISVDNNGGTSTTLDLGGNITRSGNATVDFAAASGTLGATAIIRTGQANDGTGIVGPWATVNGGEAYATVVGNVVVAYAGYVDISGSDPIADGTATNVRINSSAGTTTLGAGTTNINTLSLNTSGTETIDTGGNTLRLGVSGGIMNTKSGGQLIIGTGVNQGTLTAGGSADNVAGEIVVGNFSTSTITINSQITDNGTGIVSLTKTGSGELTLNGSNTYTGVTTINEGRVNLNASGANSISGNLQINGGSAVLLQSNQIDDSRTVTVSGGTLDIGTNSDTVANVQLVSGAINGSGGTLSSNGSFDLQSGSVGAILGGVAGLSKTTEGTVVLNGVNTYTGATTINGGTLRMNVNDGIATTSGVNIVTGTFDLNSTNQTILSLTGAGTVNLDYGRLTVGDANNSTYNGVIVGLPDLTNSSGAVVQAAGGLTKVGGGILTLGGQNLYSGTTIISAGTLQAGVANAISKMSSVSVASGAAFDLNNFNQSVGAITGAGNITLGSANLTTTNSDVNAFGTDFDTKTFSGVISGTGGLIKMGYYHLLLSGANTYTGTTEIRQGAIQLSGSLAGQVTLDNVSGDARTGFRTQFDVLTGGSIDLSALANQTIVSATDNTTITNAGTLKAGDNSTGISVVNFNIIQNKNALTVGNDSTGVKLTSNNSFLNEGTITVGNATTGAFGIDGVSGNAIQNDGTITVGTAATGVRLLSQNTFVNTETMTIADNGVGVNVGSENFISNSGTMTATTTGTQGFLVRGTDNTLVNQKGGEMTAAVGVVVTNTSGSNAFANLGTLTGSSNVAYNSTASTAAQRVTNAGTINGNILFGVANDTMSIATGSTTNGIMDGGSGVNTFRLVGTGSDTYNLSDPRLVNFSVLEKDGGSTWTVTGERAFTGGTTVKTGELIVSGNLISDTSVQPAGVLSGFGMVTGNVSNFGTVSPGTLDAAGTLKINGNYRQGNRGTLVIQIAGKNSGANDLLAVSGQAQLGGNLRIDRVGKVRLKLGDKITFLTAAGGVNGEFDRVDNPFNSKSKTMIVTELVYDSNSVSLQAVQGSFVDFSERLGLTRNQKAVARSIDAAIAEGKNQKMIDFLNKQSLTKIPAEMDRVAPEELTAIYRVGIGVANQQNQNIQRRTEDLRLTNRRVTTSFQTTGQAPGYSGQIGAAGETGPEGETGSAVRAPRPSDRKWGAFLNGMGEWIRIGNTENARGYELETAGTTVGVDYRVNPNFAVGASAGYTNTGARLTEEGRLRVNGGRIGAYATYFDGGFHADASVSGGYSEYNTERAALQGRTRGQTEGAEFNAAVGAGYDWTLEALTLGALTSVEYTYLDIDGFTEQGSLAPLRFPDQQGQSIRSKLGFKATYDWQLGKILLRPEMRALWQHEFGERSLAIDSQLASGAGGIFTVYDPAVGRDSLLLGLGTSVLWSPRTSTYLFYDGEIYRKESESHNISGGLRISF